jgi:hypothetical protein
LGDFGRNPFAAKAWLGLKGAGSSQSSAARDTQKKNERI